MLVDNFLPTQGHQYQGDILNQITSRFDPGLKRPYLDKHDRACVVVNTGRTTLIKGEQKPIREKRFVSDLVANGIYDPVFNATSLRKEDWIELDRVVILSSRQRMRAWSDLAAANTFGGFNGMGKMTLEYEAMSDPGEALVDFDGLTEGRTDAPLFKLRSLPLPITHCDFWFSSRRLDISRNSTPLDTTMGEAAGRRVGEMIEKTTIGIETGPTYGTQTAGYGAHDGTSTVYGYTNYVNRNVKINMTVPTGGNPEVTLSEILTCLNLLAADKFYGPFMVYHSADWTPFMDNDYARLGGTNASMTLRDRIRAVDGIVDVRRLDYLTDTFTLIFVQMTADVARAVIGMGITTVQWPTVGGMRLNFKVMTISVPQLRSDYSGNAGLLIATTS